MRTENFNNKESKKSITVNNATKISFGNFLIGNGIEHKNNFSVFIVCKKYDSTNANNEKEYRSFSHSLNVSNCIDQYEPEKSPTININKMFAIPFEAEIIDIGVSNTSASEFDVDVQISIF